jgi:DNA polymerase-4
LDARQGPGDAAGFVAGPTPGEGSDPEPDRTGFPERVVLHLDLDAFYSSVEQRDDPRLRGKPVIVGGDPYRRGVVATASYEARRFGVRSGLPSITARRLCPQAVFVAPRFDVYRTVSETVMGVLRELSPTLERIAYDEAFIDVSDRVHTWDHARHLGETVKADIHAIVGLSASLGIATNKITAKVASDHEKPDGLTIVPSGEEARFLAPLSVRKLWGIGPRAEARLALEGIDRAAQLASASPEWIVARFGHQGLGWQALARGIDLRPVAAGEKHRQISREETFAEDLHDIVPLHEALLRMSEDLILDMRSYPPARTLTVKIRYANFTTITRQISPGTVMTAQVLPGHAKHVFTDNWDGRPVRLLGVALSNFVEEKSGQLKLL